MTLVLIAKITRKTIWLIRLTIQKTKHSLLKTIKTRIFDFIDKHLLSILRLNKILRTKYKHSNNKSIHKVALIIRNGKRHPTSSAFIRLISPLSLLERNEELSYKIYQENSTNIDKRFGYCIVQRLAFDDIKGARLLVKNIRKNKCKLILDTDDAFSLIDSNHSDYNDQLKKQVEAMEYIAIKADQIWVSTPKLKKAYSEINPSTHLIENTLDQTIWDPKLKTNKHSKKLKMIYMGTNTHDKDFKMIVQSLNKLHEKHADKFDLTMIGVSSDSMSAYPWIKRLYQPRGGAIYPRFVEWFISQGPFEIGICPLLDNSFNQYKSDIKCLDYIAAGIIPMASKVEAYSTKELKKHTILINNSPKDWFNYLDNIISNKDSFLKSKGIDINSAKKYLWSKRSVDQSAKKISDLLSL